MNRERMDSWCEKMILALAMAILVIGPVATGGVHVFDFLALELLCVLALLVWVARLWLAERPRLLWPPMSWAVAAFALLAVGRYATCEIEYVGRLEMIRVLTYAFLYFLVVNNLHKQEHVQWLTMGLVVVATAISFYALFQFFTGSHRVWNFVSPYKNRASGTYISPNHLGGLLEMVLPLALGFSVAGRLKAWARILLAYAALVILAAIAVTVSRGAWLATGAALILFLLLLLSQRQYRLPAAVILALGLGLALFAVPKGSFIRLKFERVLSGNDVKDNTRFSIWLPAFKMWQEHPLWGVGPGHFDSMFRAYRPQGVQLQPERVHNDYLNTLTDWGVAGAGLVAAALVLFAVSARKIWRALRPQTFDRSPLSGRSRFAFMLGAIVSVTAILVHSWVDFNMHIPANAIVFVTILALAASHVRFTTKQHWQGLNIAGRVLVTLILLAGCAYLAIQGARRAAEQVCLNRAQRQEFLSDAQLGSFKKAFEIEPCNSETAYAIGEAYRVRALQGAGDYESTTREAMQWYEQCMRLNPWNGYSYLMHGECLDWLGKSQNSWPDYQKAVELDPSGYFTVAHVGIHYVQSGDYPAAMEWFQRSLRLNWDDNRIAASYLDICRSRMLEAATNGPALPSELIKALSVSDLKPGQFQ